MKGVVAKVFIVCFIFGASSLFVNASSLAHDLEEIYIQENNALTTITDAINDELEQAVEDAKELVNKKVNSVKTALKKLIQEKIKRLSSKGDIIVDSEHVEFAVHPTSTVNLLQFLPASSSIPLPKIPLKIVSYTFATRELLVATQEYGSQVLIPSVLQLQNVAFSFTVRLQNESSLVVTFTGELVIGNQTIPVKVVYNHATKVTKITASVSRFTINLQILAKKLVGLNLPTALRQSVTVPKFKIVGVITSSGKSELIVSSTGGDVQVYIIYKKAGTSSKAIAVELPKAKLSSVLKDLLGLSISGIPYFGSAVLPKIALTYATRNISLPENIFTQSPLLSNFDEVSKLRKGFTALAKFSFSSDPIKFHYNADLSKLKMSPAIPEGLQLKKLTSAIPKFDLSKVPLPPGISGLLKLSVEAFDVNIKTKSIKVAVRYPGTLKIFNGLLKSTNLRLMVQKMPNTRIKLEVQGLLSISGKKFYVSIVQRMGKYVLRARAKQLPISSLISQFHSSVVPSELNFLVPKLPFFKFSIHDPRIAFAFSSSPPQIQLQGTPVISGYKTVRMSSEIIRLGAKTILVQGFELGGLNLADLLKSITGFGFFKRFAMLNLDIEASILISPETVPGVHLIGSGLKGLSIKKGVSIQANMRFPPGSKCSSDPFCAVARSLLGKQPLVLHGTIASAGSFTFFAGVSDCSLGRGIVMSHAGVEIKGGKTNSIGIVGEVKLSNPPITLAARIFLSTSGVVLELTMSGCWNNVFGAKWLEICSLQASVAIGPPVGISALSIGGEVYVGYKKCATRIGGAGFVGIDIVTPTNNYYYVNIKGKTTVGSILKAFCIKFSVPAPLAQSGFPHGFISSFSLAGVDLPHVPLSIPQGYRFNGTINILGLEASADVVIGLPNGINFKVQLPPIVLGKLLHMTASHRHKSRGPYLNAEITLLPKPRVNIEARGYLSVLGISVETMLKITNTQYIFNIQGNMLNLFKASLRIFASYRSIKHAKFKVEGSFTNQLYSKLENLVKNGLSKAGKEASAKIEGAQRKLKKFRKSLSGANRAFRAGKKEVEDAQRSFNGAIAKVNGLKKRVKRICRIRSCGKKRVCIPCPKGMKCVKKVWGKCVFWRPKFGKCCKRIPDAICHSKNAACYALRKPIEASLEVAKGLVKGAKHSLEAAKVAFVPLKGAVKAAQLAVRGAEHTLTAVKATVSVGLKASNEIAKFGINGLISIREIKFRASLIAASGGSFSGSVRAKFAGAADVTVKLKINLRDIKSMAKQLANHIGKGFSSLF